MRLASIFGVFTLVLAACSGTATGTGTSGGTSGSNNGGGVSSDSPPSSNAGSDGSSSSAPSKGTYCSQSKGRCSCYASSSSNDVRCSTTLLAGAVCCADPGWPSQGSCECELP